MWKWLSLPALALLATLAFTPDALAAPGYATGNVNMRTGPSTRYGRILTVPRGARVEIYGCSGSWCDTYYAGRRGWVSSRYLGVASGGVSSGAAVAGIVGLGVAGAIIAGSRPDHHYHWHHRHPRHYSGGHWRGPSRHWRGRPHYRPRPPYAHRGWRHPRRRY